jgi:pimeloyl-ACP methyl ester carboxylesterase
MTDVVFAAAEVVTALSPGEPVDWVGNAWGGHVGIELAARRPDLVRSLVAASSPLLPITPGQRRQITLLFRVLGVVGPVPPLQRAVLPALLTEASAADPDVVRFVTGALDRAGRRSVANAIRSFIRDRVDITDLLPRVAGPTLFVASDDREDWTPEQAQMAAASVRDGRAAVVERARALIPIEQPEAFARVVRDFWRETEHRE